MERLCTENGHHKNIYSILLWQFFLTLVVAKRWAPLYNCPSSQVKCYVLDVHFILQPIGSIWWEIKVGKDNIGVCVQGSFSGLDKPCSDKGSLIEKSLDHTSIEITHFIVTTTTWTTLLHITLCTMTSTDWMLTANCQTTSLWTLFVLYSELTMNYLTSSEVSPLNTSRWCNASRVFYVQIFPGPSTSFYRLRIFWKLL
jgi:hypothetical protein